MGNLHKSPTYIKYRRKKAIIKYFHCISFVILRAKKTISKNKNERN
jgi:hypothetical protein